MDQVHPPRHPHHDAYDLWTLEVEAAMIRAEVEILTEEIEVERAGHARGALEHAALQVVCASQRALLVACWEQRGGLGEGLTARIGAFLAG